MFIDIGVIALGMILSYFLKDIQFLSLNFDFMNTGLINPDFLLMYVIFFALYRGEFSGLWVGFFAGLLEDGANWVIGSGPADFTPLIGIHSLVYCLIGFAVGKMNRIVDRQQTLPIMALVGVTAFLVRFFTWTLQGIVENFNHNYSMLGVAIYTAVLAPIFFTLLGWLYRMKPAGEA